ncbi:hypothetical protein IX53_03920 [Kosmotoga pacifica]|uniref:S-layer protein n=2 Tax=Kosmotoga pacifica TaxID=1330330 RepID=A0A0G2ZHG3_9BACT|nr:hypothetical protein IX53_03920 [Kosmotoga pacifica]
MFVLITIISLGAVGYDLNKVIIVPTPQEFKVSIWLDRDPGSLYKSGEEVKVFFKTNADAYVAIYDIMPDGRVQLIFPNKYDTNNFVKANKEYTLPTESTKLNYRLLVSGESGMEIFQIVASKQQLPFLKSVTKNFSKEAFPYFEDLAENFIEKLVKPFVEKNEYAVAQTFFYVNARPTMGTLAVNTTPSGARIYIDGSYYGTSPLRVSLAGGTHLVSLYKPGYILLTKLVNIRAGATAYLNVALSAVEQFTLNIDSDPSGAGVYIDGTFKGYTPLTIKLPAGVHKLEVEKKDYERYSETLNITGQTNKFVKLRFLGYLLTITSDPSNAEVYINGDYVGRTPLKVKVSKGVHRIEIKKEGYQDYSILKNITGSGSIAIKLVKVQPREGIVYLNYTQDRVNIYVDGVFYGVSPSVLKLEAGTHYITATKEGYEAQEYRLIINAGSEYYLNIILRPKLKPVILEITTDPPDARVFINGNEIGRSPVTIDLDPGYYEVLIVKEGYHFVYLVRYFDEGKHTLSFNLLAIEE